ncbi:MAG: GHMP kinase [Synergistaceae bacterium]|nr:GHMP kinase [Synergistaceae bacterium]
MGRILAEASLPAAVGEWVQGWIGGRESLVSLVVSWRGAVELRVPDDGEISNPCGEKSLRAFEKAKKIFAGSALETFPDGSRVNVINPLPVSKGLATSTMDVAGTFAACAAYAGAKLSDERLFSLCASVEPSDGIMFDGLALVDHIKGELMERLPGPPPMTLVAVIPRRTLDTDVYRRDVSALKALRGYSREHERAYDILKRGLAAGNAALVASAATLSAEIQQGIMPKEEWDALVEARALTGALGIAAAHSGTASGLLYAPANKFGAELAEKWLADALRAKETGVATRQTPVLGGGVFSKKTGIRA